MCIRDRIEEVRDEILYSHNLRNKDCIPLTQEEFAQKLADRNEIQSYRMKQFQQSGHDCYLVMQDVYKRQDLQCHRAAEHRGRWPQQVQFGI